MALFHRATLTPSKAELIAMWAPTQPWGPSADDVIDVVGSYRFDDPDGRVGLETHLVTALGVLLTWPALWRRRHAEETSLLEAWRLAPSFISLGYAWGHLTHW